MFVADNGIDWAIDHVAEKSIARLAGGAFPNGGQQKFSAGEGASTLQSINVKAGDFVQVDVFPNLHSYKVSH